MNTKIIEITLFAATLLSGFYAGTGFFVAMGGNPAIKLMSDHTFAEYWQHVDHFMAARMKIFGPLLLVTMLAATLVLLKEWRTPAFWCMLIGTLIIITDVVLTIKTHMPFNQLIQSWDLSNLPANVQEIKLNVVHAFDRRLVFMISSFIMVLLTVWLRKDSR